MDEGQLFVLGLSFAVLVAFSIELAGSIGDYREHRAQPERRRGAPLLRDLLKSFVIWIGVLEIFAGRAIVAFVLDAGLRRWYGLLSGAALAGALIVGGLALAWSRLSERDEVDA